MTSPGGTGAMHGGPGGPAAGPLPGYPQDIHPDVPVKVERITAVSTGKSKFILNSGRHKKDCNIPIF